MELLLLLLTFSIIRILNAHNSLPHWRAYEGIHILKKLTHYSQEQNKISRIPTYLPRLQFIILRIIEYGTRNCIYNTSLNGYKENEMTITVKFMQ